MGKRVMALFGLLGVVVPLVIWPATPAAAVGGLEGVPHFDHVFVLVEENESFATTFDPSGPAKYLNATLVPASTLDDQYFATGHVSLDNYVSMTSGQMGNGLTNTDCLLGQAVNLWTCVQPQGVISGGRNLGDQLDDAGVTWKQYSDGTTKSCVHADYSPTATGADPYQGAGKTPTNNGAGKDFADRHVGFLYYPDIIGADPRCQAHLKPFTDLAGDITAGQVPGFGFITPDTCNDGHDAPCVDSGGNTTAPGGLTSADKWLSPTGGGKIGTLLSYLYSHNGLLLLTFDEGAVSDFSGCCGGTAGVVGGGRIGLLALSSCIKPGQVIHTPYNHYSLLRTIEDNFSISEHLNNSGSATAMSDLFNGSSCPRTSVTPSNPGIGSSALPNTSALTAPWWPGVTALLLLGGLAIGRGARSRRRQTR
ncbi:MAG TPA: alkaline phosphatase family protein [Candidatus Dormibacteraeota bacterium]|jgi:hypothetical protein|nr:alkaline phosphatase family protein [Candidatus Dormibacteraeota bacterium]